MADSKYEDSNACDLPTWSASATGSNVERELARELVRAALFQRGTPRIGRYRVGPQLGAGASAVVHAAHDEQLDRPVAIKIFVARSSGTQLHVLREARALAQLSHPNVVTVYEVGEWNDHAFIAMELIRGTTLAHWQDDPRRSIHELLAAYLQAGRGLEAAHRAALVHRDFKPANVMVAETGRVAVTDFGLVSHVASGVVLGDPGDSAADTHARVGTPAYVAPEQIRGTSPHPSADIYSFALALGWALARLHPVHQAVAWRRALVHKVPRRLLAAISAGLAMDPAARGPSITPLLAAIAATLPRSARRAALSPPWLHELKAAPRRWPVYAALAVTGVAIALGGARMLVDDRQREATDPRGADVLRVFHAATLSTLRERAGTALDMGPSQDGADAVAELRSLRLQPLPHALRCAWPSSGKVRALMLGDGYLVGHDEHGDALVCMLADGTVSVIARHVRCVGRVGPHAIGVLDQDGAFQTYRDDGGGWQRMPVGLRFAIPDPREKADCTNPVPASGGVVPAAPEGIPDRTARYLLQTSGTRERWIVDRTRQLVLASISLPTPPGIAGFAVGADGTSIVVARADGPLYWWSAGTTAWRSEPVYFQSDFVRAVDMSPDGRRALLISWTGSVEVRTLGGGEAWWLTDGSIADATFVADDTVVGVDMEGQIWRWHLPSLRSGLIAIYREQVWSIAINAEVIVSGSEDGTAEVVDRRTGALRLRVSTGNQIYKVVLDRDRLVIAGNGGLYVWNWRTGERLPMASGGDLRIWDVEAAVAADGSRTYLAGAIRSGDVWLWPSPPQSSPAPTPLGRMSDRDVHGVALTPDGRTGLVTSNGGTVTLLDVPGQRVIATGTNDRVHNPSRLLFDTTIRAFVTAGTDGYLTVWSSTDASRLLDIRIGSGPSYAMDVHAGRAIVSSGNTLVLVDLRTGQIVRRYRGHHSELRVGRFRADGQWFVTGDEEGRTCLWRVDETECHTWLEGHYKTVSAIEFAEDGTIFTAAHDGTVRYWRPTYDQPTAELYTALAQMGYR